MRTIYGVLTVLFLISVASDHSFAQGCTVDFTGANLLEKTAEAEVYIKPDGTKITRFRDRSEAQCSDGTKVISYPDGRRIVHKPGGEVIEFRADGSVVYMGNGQKREVSLRGKTPYGLEIKDENKTIKRGNYSVDLVYSSALSDDVMDNYVRSFYTELSREIERWIYSNNMKPGRVQVMMSNCRFCVTGFCVGKKNPGLEIIAIDQAANEKKFFVSREDLINKNRHADLALKAVDALFGK